MKKASLLALVFVISCGVMNAPCTDVQLGSRDIISAQRSENNALYMFNIPSSELKGYFAQVIRGHEDETFKFDIVHPDLKEKCEPLKQRDWAFNQDVNTSTGMVKMSGKASVKCGGKTYCFNFSYQGKIEEMPGMKTDE